MVVRTGADPILEGGGEFARENDVVVMDALSDIISLTGVPDLSNRVAEARLGWRDEGSPGGCIELADEGADMSVLGNASVLGVGNTLKVLGAFRMAGDKTLAEAGVLGGKAGKSDGADCFTGVSPSVEFGSVSFIDCIARLRVGTAAVDRLVVDFGSEGVATGIEVVLGFFLTAGVNAVGLLEVNGFAVGVGSFDLPGSSEGKSSGCKVTLPWADISLERPVFAAKDLTSRFACIVTALALGAVGVGGTETFVKGVAARGMYDELVAREGVKGAEVGTIRDTTLPIGSSFDPEFGVGCA